MKKILFSIFFTLLFVNVFGQWKPTSSGLGGGDIRCIVKYDEDIFASGPAGGIFHSNDNGDFWESISNGLPEASVSEIFKMDSYLFAGTSYWSSKPQGVFRSADNGLSWLPVNNGIYNSGTWQQLSIAAFAENNSILYVATEYDGIYKSEDYGDNWVLTSDTSMHYWFTDILVFGSEIFASTQNHGLLTSSDWGQTWVPLVSVGLPTNYRVEEMVANEDKIFLRATDGFYRSSDNGESWVSINSGISHPSGAYVGSIYVEGDTVLVSTSYDLYCDTYKSINNGSTWTRIDAISGVQDGNARQVYALLKSNNYIFAGNSSWYGISAKGGGIVRSADHGVTWENANNGLSCMRYCYDIDWEENNFVIGTGLSTGLFISNNEALSWTRSILPGTSNYNEINSVLIDNSVFYAGVYAGYQSPAECGLYKSEDNGLTWTNSGSFSVAVTAIEKINLALFAGTKDDGMRRSTDNGTTWEEINSGLTSAGERKIKTISKDGSSIYIGTGRGVLKSIDNGDNWTAINGGSGSPGYSLTYSVAAKGDTIIAGTSHGLIFSTDMGTTWTDKLLDMKEVRSVVADSNFLYIGGTPLNAYNNSVLVSNNWGETWYNLNSSDLSFPPVYSLTIKNDTLYAGTKGLGVWKYPLYKTPVQPEEIFGELYPCIGSVQTYSVTPFPGGRVDWTFPSDWSEVERTEFSISILIGTESGEVVATPYTAYGSGDSQTIIINLVTNAPVVSSEISGDTLVCLGFEQVYSIENIPGLDFTWAVPANWTLVSGQGTNSITVLIGETNGQIEVTPSNSCGNGESQLLNIAIPEAPTSGFSADNTTILVNETITLTDESTDATSWEWTITPFTGITFVNGTDATSQNPQVSFANEGMYDVELFVTGLCGDNSVLKNNYITVNILDGISETSKGNISVYPNPASSVITIETNITELNSRIEIINPNGQIVYNGLLENPTRKEINIENLNSGIYVIKITNNRGSKFMKFLVQ